MGMLDRLKGMFGDHSDKAADMTAGAKDRAMDAGQQASEKAQEHLPGPAADAMGNMTGRTAPSTPGTDEQVQQAKSDMESEGGPEWER
ncbi:hypothetical protein OG455_25665 [Kitasatospora sp. NBC_01287]|uniref:hypothetical protein n=1 Tax=Kitasatospora sp. NBC_01287 TaxID=2903573 RepID=UPI00224E809A|nr:hypothetical protein [Kitasatospora sp. NBC_01287]MCX4748862.1 hypothetical protein [Kitasatospora sp. NBC_01287]